MALGLRQHSPLLNCFLVVSMSIIVAQFVDPVARPRRFRGSEWLERETTASGGVI